MQSDPDWRHCWHGPGGALLSNDVFWVEGPGKHLIFLVRHDLHAAYALIFDGSRRLSDGPPPPPPPGEGGSYEAGPGCPLLPVEGRVGFFFGLLEPPPLDADTDILT